MQAKKLQDSGGGLKGLVRRLGKVQSKSNSRSLYLDKNPGLPKGWPIHYSLPPKYEGIIRNTSICIHAVKYFRGLDPKVHPKNEWTRWNKSLGRVSTGQELINFEKINIGTKIKRGKVWITKNYYLSD